MGKINNKSNDNNMNIIIGAIVFFIVGVGFMVFVIINNNGGSVDSLPSSVQGSYIEKWTAYNIYDYIDEIVLSDTTADYIIWQSNDTSSMKNYAKDNERSRVTYTIKMDGCSDDEHCSFDLYNSAGEKKYECNTRFGAVTCTGDTGHSHVYNREK